MNRNRKISVLIDHYYDGNVTKFVDDLTKTTKAVNAKFTERACKDLTEESMLKFKIKGQPVTAVRKGVDALFDNRVFNKPIKAIANPNRTRIVNNGSEMYVLTDDVRKSVDLLSCLCDIGKQTKDKYKLSTSPEHLVYSIINNRQKKCTKKALDELAYVFSKELNACITYSSMNDYEWTKDVIVKNETLGNPVKNELTFVEVR